MPTEPTAIDILRRGEAKHRRIPTAELEPVMAAVDETLPTTLGMR
jgi:hypothetical protein